MQESGLSDFGILRWLTPGYFIPANARQFYSLGERYLGHSWAKLKSHAFKIEILLELDHPLASYTDMVEVYVSVQITL